MILESKTPYTPKLIGVILLLLLCHGAVYPGISCTKQSDIRISVDFRNALLTETFSELERQSGCSFEYRHELFRGNNPRINLHVEALPLNEVMDRLLANTGLSYKQHGSSILILSGATDRPQPTTGQNARQEQVSGWVTDSLDNPLAGVSILVECTERGTSTDAQGRFQIPASEGDILVVRNVGYVTQEVIVGNQPVVNVVLQETLSGLDEVVVVAYGTQKKATLTGSIATINTKEIKQSPAANLAVTLAGRLPGLTSIQNSGEPGRDNTLLYLRGRGTLNGQSPLILVDGVERDLTYIDPNEVDNITILKDASSTALFGVRGANGVILVTTKRGSNARPQISFSVEQGLQHFTRNLERLNSHEWAMLKNEAWRNDNPDVEEDDPTRQPPYSAYALERFQLQDYPEVYPNNDWQDILMKDVVGQTRYTLNLSGGSEWVQYFVNVGHLAQDGQWKVDPDLTYDPSPFLNRSNFRSNIDAFLNKGKTLKTFLNAAGYLEKVNSPNMPTNTIFSILNSRIPATMPGPLTPDGEVLTTENVGERTPWALINRTGYRQETRSNVTASWGLQQDLKRFTEGLSAKFMISFDTRSIYNLTAARSYQVYVQQIDPNTPGADGRDSVAYQRIRPDFDNTPLSTSTSTDFQSFFNLQLYVNYNRVFHEKHAVTGLLLAQQEQRIRPGDRLPFNLRGLASRLTYGYDSKYFFEVNMGYNGSEQFAKGKRYGFFPTVSGGWVVTNESFLRDSEVMTLLKIRGSYGRVGSDQLGGRRFLYLDDIQRSGGGFSETLGRGGIINETFLGNPDVSWETSKKANLGLDVGLFEDIALNIDLFSERRDNVLINRGTVPILNGIPTANLAPVNTGVVENRGYEIELNYNKVFNPDFSFLAKVNFNRAKNKVVFADEARRPNTYVYPYRTTGYQIGQNFGYMTNGFYNSQEEIDEEGLTYIGRAPRAGDLRFVDLNEDGFINDEDLAPIRNSIVPEYTFGAALGINYKSFDVSVLFQGVAGVSANLGGTGIYEQTDFTEKHLHAWTPERAASGYPISFPALSIAQSSSEGANDFFIQDKSFIRLKNAEIGYSLPKSLAAKIAAQNIRFYVNGFNLLTWDRMRWKDFDPELGGGDIYPIYRVFNAGVNVVF